MNTLILYSTLSLLLTHTEASTDDGWSMTMPAEVRAIEGYPVVLPCSFTHPHHTHHSSIQVVWRIGHWPGSTTLFQCTSLDDSHRCQARPSQDQRYRLEGNPREHDLSLRISSVALQDSGRYYCRLEVPGHPPAVFENKMGTRLRVEAPPRILGLSVVPSEVSGFKALCRVQGSPSPDVQWVGPEDVIEGAPAYPLQQEAPSQHLTFSQLQDVQAGGQYTCAASNPLGKDQATLFILPSAYVESGLETSPSPLLLLFSVSLGAKLALLLGVAVWVAKGHLSSWLSCMAN
ncbi:V-set and Ig domain-containing protein [Alosa alosa]|uniref:V-set and Ig domain-containing protein n=1 Tax=Alosa alosa TaxID=278164 RepID=UPI0020153F9A|nr:V-set and Ig domain-containing protein [Alosa alosa]